MLKSWGDLVRLFECPYISQISSKFSLCWCTRMLHSSSQCSRLALPKMYSLTIRWPVLVNYVKFADLLVLSLLNCERSRRAIQKRQALNCQRLKAFPCLWGFLVINAVAEKLKEIITKMMREQILNVNRVAFITFVFQTHYKNPTILLETLFNEGSPAVDLIRTIVVNVQWKKVLNPHFNWSPTSRCIRTHLYRLYEKQRLNKYWLDLFASLPAHGS